MIWRDGMPTSMSKIASLPYTKLNGEWPVASRTVVLVDQNTRKVIYPQALSSFEHCF